ncbi:hypothetical protein VTH06DRAFT_1650 [Thermothelomyces fergusii]
MRPGAALLFIESLPGGAIREREPSGFDVMAEWAGQRNRSVDRWIRELVAAVAAARRVESRLMRSGSKGGEKNNPRRFGLRRGGEIRAGDLEHPGDELRKPGRCGQDGVGLVFDGRG